MEEGEEEEEEGEEEEEEEEDCLNESIPRDACLALCSLKKPSKCQIFRNFIASSVAAQVDTGRSQNEK